MKPPPPTPPPCAERGAQRRWYPTWRRPPFARLYPSPRATTVCPTVPSPRGRGVAEGRGEVSSLRPLTCSARHGYTTTALWAQQAVMRPRADVAQWQSSCFVNSRLSVRARPSALSLPWRYVCICVPRGRLEEAFYPGQLPKWPNGTDCKSVGLRLRRFESSTAHPSGGAL